MFTYKKVGGLRWFFIGRLCVSLCVSVGVGVTDQWRLRCDLGGLGYAIKGCLT